MEANRFTERLGLPNGWLDTPRSEAEIPESVSRMLTPASRGRASAQQHEPLAVAKNDGVPGELAVEKAHTRRARAGALGDSESPTPVSADVAGEKETTVVSLQDHARDFPDALAGRTHELNGIEPIAEALIKTLAGKARTGRLDELKALDLLQQAVLL
ncbi:hypothetical protein G3N94_13140 [Burkholderia sp. Ac-20353]|nr:hypothetical protein [Burkholderia sp. Ac-20353]